MKTKWKVLTAVLPMTLISTPVLAEEWLRVGQSGDQMIVCDRDRISYSSEDWNIWVAPCRYFNIGRDSGGPEVVFTDFAAGAHCPQRRAFIYVSGEVEEITTRQGTIGSQIYNFLCSQR